MPPPDAGWLNIPVQSSDDDHDVPQKLPGDLLQKLQAKDPQALAALHQSYAKKVYREAFRIVRRPAVAEDIAQEAFLRLWNRADLLDEEQASVVPWLFAIARNCALDYLRNEQRRTALLADCPEVTLQVQSVEPEEATDLKRAIGKLPGQERRVLELAYYEGLSQRHIAALLDEPLGTVKSWSRLGLKRLRGGM